MDLSIVFLYVRAILRELWIHKFKAVLAGFMVGFIVLMIGTTWPVKYESSMTIFADNQNILAPLLSSQATVVRVSDQVRLVQNAMLSPSIVNKVIEDAYQLKGISLSEKELEEYGRQLRGNITIRGVGQDHIQITYTNESPDDTYEILSAISDAFIEDASERKRSDSREAFLFIDNQVKQYKSQLLEAEETLKNFNAQNTDGTLQEASARITALKDEIENIRFEMDELRARIKSINDQLSQESRFSARQYKADIYRERLIQLQRNKETLLLNLTQSHPDVIQLNYQIEDAQRELENAERDDLESKSNIDEKAINPLYEELRTQLAETKLDLSGKERLIALKNQKLEREFERKELIAEREAERAEITRDYQVTKSKYDEMLNQKEKARLSMTISLEGQGVTYKVKEPPQYPLVPVGLQFKQFAVFGVIAIIIVPIAIVSAYVILDANLRFPLQLNNILESIPVTAVVPHELSPVKQRLMRKDMVLVGLMVFFLLTAYIGLTLGYIKDFF